jgi:iduronate 2-sulfatase
MKKLITLGLIMTAVSALAQKPNVLFLAVDDLRAELGCYGVEHVYSPNIDSLAERAMRFDNAYVQSSFCNPCRASFLTGLRPDKTGVLDNKSYFRDNLPDVQTLPELFRKNGYYACNIGKIFHGPMKMCDPERSWDRCELPTTSAIGRKGSGRDMSNGMLKWCNWRACEGGDEEQADGQSARLAVEFLETEQRKPFFLAVGFHKPHDPFHAPAKYFELYPQDKIKLYRDPDDLSSAPIFAKIRGFAKVFDKFTERDRKEFMRAYLACISFTDAQIGRVLNALQSSPYSKNTIIVFVSDHGYHLGQRNWWNKNTLYEHTSRAPLLIHTPEMRMEGASCSSIVEFVDIYPTLVELCGISAPSHELDGRSFVALLDNPRLPFKETAYMQLTRGKVDGRAVRDRRYRYIEFDRGAKGRELFDHKNDPDEFYNLAGNPEYSDVLNRMRTLLHNGPQ